MSASVRKKKMENAQSNLFTRSDTLFGVCEAIGQDFGFHANLLRVPFAVGLLWNPWVMIGAYLVLGLVVALSRWLVPSRRPAKAVAIEQRPVEAAVERAPVEHVEEMAIAA